MSIGLRSWQVAAAAGLNLQTLRYYERRGLLEKPACSPGGGHWLYPPESVALVQLIKAAQRLGFTLDGVAELVEAGRHRHGRRAGGLQARAAGKRAEIEAKIADPAACADNVSCPMPFGELASSVPAGEPGQDSRAAGRSNADRQGTGASAAATGRRLQAQSAG